MLASPYLGMMYIYNSLNWRAIDLSNVGRIKAAQQLEVWANFERKLFREVVKIAKNDSIEVFQWKFEQRAAVFL